LKAFNSYQRLTLSRQLLFQELENKVLGVKRKSVELQQHSSQQARNHNYYPLDDFQDDVSYTYPSLNRVTSASVIPSPEVATLWPLS
jgi:predicted P-loop ATPase